MFLYFPFAVFYLTLIVAVNQETTCKFIHCYLHHATTPIHLLHALYYFHEETKIIFTKSVNTEWFWLNMETQKKQMYVDGIQIHLCMKITLGYCFESGMLNTLHS
jgi:hypothetical protein